MAVSAVWGLDVGQCALKAVKARAAGQLIEVLAFDHIEYKKPLSTAGTDASATIREALQTFLSRNNVEECAFSVSIAAGRSALVRFIKLPPVDRRKVPDIVRYEASQQIPFPLEDVIWDHQVIERNYAPGEELEVGLFAMRREAIFDFLSNLMVSGIDVENIQLSAVALYNCVRYDQPSDEGATMAVDIGAENTNLVVVDANSVWTRSLPIGGNDFTRAIATKSGIDFEQAENLKRNMEKSGKAQEVFEALRPSLRSLLDEIQRSAGYYRSLHKSTKFVKLLGFGAGFRMFGVQRFLEAGLAYPVESFEKTNNIQTQGAVNQQFFKKNAPAYGPALGLVVQGLGLAGINTTLMPPAIIQERLLKKKRPLLIAAAALLAASFAWPMVSAYTQPTAFDISGTEVAKSITQKSKDSQVFVDNAKKQVDPIRNELSTLIAMRERRSEQLKAFDALLAALPKDGGHPVYVRQVTLESGSDKWIKERVLDPQVTATPGAGPAPVFQASTIRKPPLIEAGEIVKEATTTRRRGAMDRDALIEKRESLQQQREDARQERLSRLGERAAAQQSAGPAGTQKSGLDDVFKISPPGLGQIVVVILETTDPRGFERMKEIAAALRKGDGVLYCEVINSEQEQVWIDKITGARLSSQPSSEYAGAYGKADLTTAVIQWVYQKGGKPNAAKVAGKAAGAPAAARPAGGVPAEAQDAPADSDI